MWKWNAHIAVLLIPSGLKGVMAIVTETVMNYLNRIKQQEESISKMSNAQKILFHIGGITMVLLFLFVKTAVIHRKHWVSGQMEMRSF
jgi:hypothetical protein